MHDRLILSLATVPMIAGTLTLGLLSRGEAEARPPAESVAGRHTAPATPRPRSGWVGVVVAAREAELASEVPGRVAQVFVRDGQRVVAGEPLVEIDHEGASAALEEADADLDQRRSDVQRARARLDAARQRLSRMQAGAEWLSAQELDVARAEVRIAVAELRSAESAVAMGKARRQRAEVHAQKHTLVAPFEGTVADIQADVGDSVQPHRVLARVLGGQRQVRFALPRPTLPDRPLDYVWLTAPSLEGSLRARVDEMRPEVDPAAQLVIATADLPLEEEQGSHWMPGTHVEVWPEQPDGER